MDLSNKVKNLPFDFKNLNYKKLPDPLFDPNNKFLLGEMFNDKVDENKHDLNYMNHKGWKNFAWCFYKLRPGCWVPPHKDHFHNYAKFYKVENKNKIKRAIVFLEDWKPGHVFGMNNKIIINWKAEETYEWAYDVEHWGGNFGTEDRYTLQLTGTDDS